MSSISWVIRMFQASIVFDVISTFDPDLQLYRGRQYLPTDKANFGIFSDSSPDRFGRMLMSRREAILAKKEDRKPRALTEKFPSKHDDFIKSLLYLLPLKMA